MKSLSGTVEARHDNAGNLLNSITLFADICAVILLLRRPRQSRAASYYGTPIDCWAKGAGQGAAPE